MRIQDLAGKNVCILGFGKEGKAMAEALEKYAPTAEITIADKDEKIEVKNPKYWKQIGSGWLENLNKFDVVIKSPGVPPQKEFKTYAEKITTSTQIFFDSIEGTGATVIGVTGSKGKSTTSSLLYAILKAGKKDVFFVGNIGEAAVLHIKDAKSGTLFVFEMSSYQLSELTVSPHIAVLTSFFTEHLDYHGTLEAYREAKANITRHQKKSDIVFYHSAFPVCKELALLSPGTKVGTTEKDAPVTIEETKLVGKHNLGNIALAWKVAESLGVDKKIAIEAIKNFTPLPHRLETVAATGSIQWINDSISTTPESAIVALDTLGDAVQTMILGGQDRGYNFVPLAERLSKSNVQTVVLLAESGKTIGELLKKYAPKIKLVDAANMKDAVKAAASAPEGSIVLLSPASPSYGLFKNFEDRGDQFRAEVAKFG